ncbi:hypothetical protein HRR90_003783 [Exophiala dermatitidis]|uniref:Uncharacterized protein n=2 Tax=Exophiala dermatitidis TaxID=5970 RepID=H6BN80_EXODN|nr:uncharacterized protein HMPREF1120_01346 [Exophiala dermatitidis NIH/UT8656]KAJ4548817.1 hypothetical protein HRR76_001397 [Exophiala dermatitidis]EHY53148.1 hypothetical protein HMPREF1120_01346 [Exophiala dermatitidis NIH/UT8656]KAJ4550604.1 hypothetical protein HRR78_004373 [Exophiala dermatitidis]KAJ4652597.1 hypothetical protein HRR91_004946 [Exophiala dermatitidis]KAJ4654985.1 hypothetical protein HRR90_003783 [Exophiala dermatitidis]
MHAIGASHNCFSCIQADEMHNGRHRRIAELLNDYHAAVVAESNSLESCRVKTKSRPGLGELPVNIHHAVAFPFVDAGDGLDVENADRHDWYDDRHDHDANTDETVSTDGWTSNKQPKMTKAETRAMKRAAKQEKKETKAFKNQAKHHNVGIHKENIDFVATILHGDAKNDASNHPLASDKTIEEVMQRNLGFLSAMEDHNKDLMASIAKRRKSDRERRSNRNNGTWGKNGKKRRSSGNNNHDADDTDDEAEYLLVAVLTNLGVHSTHIPTPTDKNGKANAIPKSPWGGGMGNVPGANAEIAAIVANLKALVKEDLERHENELRETWVRAGGFWRYVGKAVFDRMTEIAKNLDWKTGAKLH